MPGLQSVTDILSKGIYGIAGLVAIVGLVTIGFSISNENPQQRSIGFYMLGGAFIVALAATLVSQIPGWFS